VRSVLSSSYPTSPWSVVDDHSDDGTAEAALEAAAGDRASRW
jgi:glycosyltransferase involved in cell wall biosynthesis